LPSAGGERTRKALTTARFVATHAVNAEVALALRIGRAVCGYVAPTFARVADALETSRAFVGGLAT